MLYAALGIATVLILRTMAHRWRAEGIGEAEVPYGPSEAAPPPAAPTAREAGMSTADAVAGVLWVGATLYAVFGGADFGAGFWVAARRHAASAASDARALIDWAIGPVWEANHVWLIFVLVVLWTAFSVAFESIMSTLFIPLSLAALGIVLRGSGFAFHKLARRLRNRRLAERAFGALLGADARSSWAPSSARSPPDECRSAMRRETRSPAG